MKLKTELLIQPTGDMWKKIRVELNETPSNNARDLAIIKEWLRKQPHLPDEWEDQPLMTFLRGCNFSLEKCKSKLDMYFTMRTACPEFFKNRDATLPALSEVINNRVQGPPLPGITPNGYRVTLIRGTHPSMDSSQVTDSLKAALMVGDIRLLEEVEGVAGDVYVMDASVLGPSLLVKLSPSVLKKFLIVVQEAFPVKLKEIHVLNTSALVDRFVTFVKPFLKEKIRNRIFIHRDLKTLYEHIPREMLPKDYGGDAPCMDDLSGILILRYYTASQRPWALDEKETARKLSPAHLLRSAQWNAKLIDYKDWFLAQESIRATESLRPGQPKNYDELFGIDGSFRQLAID